MAEFESYHRPWPGQSLSIFSQLEINPNWSVPHGARLLQHHDKEARLFDEKQMAKDILDWCRSQQGDARSKQLDLVLSLLAERYWARHEVSLVIKKCDWTAKEQKDWCTMLGALLLTSPDFLTVCNTLELLSECKATVSAEVLSVLARHKRLAFPCFDILRNLQLTDAERETICTTMFPTISGYRKLLCLRMMEHPISFDLAKQVLETPIEDIGQFGYPVADNIDQYLEFLSFGRPREYLRQSEPSDRAIRNLISTYALIAEILFWDETVESDELIGAFPVFVDLLDGLTLELEDLYNLSSLHAAISDETSTPHSAMIEKCAAQIGTILKTRIHRERVAVVLSDPSHPDHVDMIDVAEQAYKANAFDLYFSLAQTDPERALASSHWLYDIRTDQRRLFLDWFFRQFSLDQVGQDQGTRASRNYSKTQKLVLDKVLIHPAQLLLESEDRLATIQLGLRSDDTVLRMNTAWLLEDLPTCEWPTGAEDVLRSLLQQIEPQWTTWNHREGRYNKAGDRLQSLINKTASNGSKIRKPSSPNEED